MKKLHDFLFLIVISLCFGSQPANSTSHNRAWGVATIMGPVTDNTAFRYYLEPQLRLINDNSVFNQLLILGGLGYQLNQNMTLFVGPGWIATKTTNSNLIYEKRLWQQLNWQILNNLNWNINSRTRLEERKREDNSSMALRFRQRIWMRLPLKKWPGYSFSCFDEVFFNLNHPEWTSPRTFEQNRAFIGFSRQLSKSTVLDLGYLNQRIYSVQNQLNHVLSLGLTVVT